MLSIQSLSKTYDSPSGKVEALVDASFDFPEGKITAIVGPSGSGKSTLLNLMAGFDTPTTGQVILDGKDLGSLTDAQRAEMRLHEFGFVFQSYNLIPVLTAKENAEFIMLLQKVSKDERDTRVMKLLREVGLEEKIDVRPNKLSGGQQQRVAVARALASHPEFVLADEPTANLDSKSASDLLDIMARLNKEENMTFIFSTHDQRVIDRANRIITLVDGQIHSDVIQEHSSTAT